MASSKQEFVLRHTVKNFSSLKSHLSPVETHFGVPWRMSINYNDNEKIGLCLHCKLDFNSTLWKIKVQTQYGLISKNGEFMRYKDEGVHDTDFFSRRSFSMGYDEFAKKEDVAKDCVKNNELIAEIRVTIVEMTGISWKKKKNFDEPNGKMSDVCLVVDGKKFHASKAMLAEQSSVFEAMFFGDFVEAESKEVVIEGTEEDCFEVFLSLIYYVECEITAENVEELLKLGDRYNVPRVFQKCEKFLLTNNDVSISTKFVLSEKHSLANLQKHCLDGLKTKKDMEMLKNDMEDMGVETMKALYEKALSLWN